MDKEKQYLIDILTAFINQEPVERQENIDWMKIKYLADIHSVTGIVGYVAKQSNLLSQEQGLPLFWNACMSSIYLFTQRAERMRDLSRKMQEAQIDHILFKGYVVKDYYPVPELRSYGDIDLVIHLEDRPRSHELMLQNGYQVKSDWEAVFSYYKDIEYYEIHSDIMEIDVTDKADYRGFFQHMWEHTVRVDDYVWEFKPEFHFIYLLTHIAKHIYGSGAGVRMYLDLAAFILHFGDQIDWNWVRTELETIQLYDFCCVALTAVKNWFGVESPMELHPVPDDVMETFLDFTLDGGVFGHVNRESGVNALKHAESNGKSASRVKVLLKRLFPPATEIESRYTYLQNKHWLLPVAWVHRVIKTRGEISQHTHEANVILSADTDEVQRLKKLNEAIGL
ncbi:MAG: nucleotidyltransferase family protein [Clostridiales bacterium]|nr:nucleotidyltransferase family protein [Clostridiales bacterium]